MAGKKRRADKPPAQPKSSFSVEAKTRLPSGGSGVDGVQTWLLPALGALGLVGAWLALLGGFADGTIDWRLIFGVDTVAPRVQFRELFLRQDGPGWATSGTAPYYFPDVLTQWALAALGVSVMTALYLAPLLQAALAAVGWIAVCDFLFGKSPARRCAVLLLQALPLLVLAWRGPDLFYAQLSTVSHYGVWTLLPWLLWLSLRVVASDAPGKPGKKRGAPIPAAFAAGLIFLLAAAVASDLFIGLWFVAPAGFVAVLLAWTRRMERPLAARFVGLLAAGCVLGLALRQLPPLAGLEFWRVQYSTDLGLGVFVRALGRAAAHHWHAALRNPVEAAIGLTFVGIAIWRAAAVFRPSVRQKTPPALAVPDGVRHCWTAVFVPAAMLSALVVPAMAGLAPDYFGYLEPNAPKFKTVGAELRYYMPTWFFPLFAGWALLPGAVLRAKIVPGLALCAVAALAAPKAARIDFAAINPFATPFYQCFAENARRLNWRAGVGSLGFSALFTQIPGAEMEKMLAVGTFRQPGAGQSFMVVDVVWDLNVSGEYQFVVANAHNGRVFDGPPLAGESGCAVDDPAACWHSVADNFVLDAESARAAFGEPKEVIDCAGVGLLHYDPPLKFDFSAREHPYLAPVARW